MVVVANSETSTLWAHEFGHTRGLPHRDTNSQNIMSSTDLGGNRINQNECNAYRSSAVSGGQGSPATAVKSSENNVKLQDFVSQVFIEGLPYEEAIAYGPAAVPELIASLRDPRQEAKWPNAAVMLAMIGGPAAFDAVTAFIKDPGPGELTPHRNWARENAVMALGYYANTPSGKRALTYLRESLTPNIWKQRGVRGAIGSRSPAKSGAETEGDEGDIVDDMLTQYALIGLALSGTPEGKAAITAYGRMQGRTASQREMLKELLREHALVAQKGIAAYDKDRLVRAGQLKSPTAGIGSGKPEEPPPPDPDDKSR